MSNVVVFDLDGVITSEMTYWIAAGLVLHELLYSPRYWNVNGATSYVSPADAEECIRWSHDVLPESVMLSFKARSLNSNWDTCFAAVCLCLLYLLEQVESVPERTALFPIQPWDADWLAAFRTALAHAGLGSDISARAYQRLNEPAFQNYVGLELFENLTIHANEIFGQPVEGVFARYSLFWSSCQELFQEIYLGDELYTQVYHHSPTQARPYACIAMEQPVLPVETLHETLRTLKEQGYTLGIATGRPRSEAVVPLRNYGLWKYFDPAYVMTHTEVALAEEQLALRDDNTSLVKPHPYQFLKAADPDYQIGESAPPRGSFIVVGDTTSDVRGGQAAGAIVIAVLTGALTVDARQQLELSQPDFLIPDVSRVPELLTRLDDLITIQRMQFIELNKAEMLLRRWFTHHLKVPVDEITLTPKAVSLNSFNGIYRVGGEEYFFKTHVEEQGILEEYYHAELLHHAGYNIVLPLRTVHEKGQQMVIYPVIHAPVMFDLMRAVETGDTSQANVEMLRSAEQLECERLLAIYRETLQKSTVEEHEQAPIHQLFWHRLTGGRLQSFYEDKWFPLPGQNTYEQGGQALSFADLLQYQWTINGEDVGGNASEYGQTLGQLIERAREVLQPAQAALTVVGHGDAHFGNVFLEHSTTYQYFDPAFAGRHSPLLDVVKPFFHNVFATWMYFPQEVEQDLQISVHIEDSRIVIEHNYQVTPVRQAILATKRTHLIMPLLELLREHQALPDNWEEIVRLALMCCPLLTVNLLDTTKRSAAICWLGLSQVMQMGNFSIIGG
ncbi:HAD family hydrolase [Dictyobacter arantiisoli]|uniref:Haloacid dehalogenase n=1 Tax=Dictyobacter arantiisoli TaxID=2014874 RepID=A0A5A5TEI8_9CHLR|nr:HAD hydrolase-like protein [Dictyobacter arantiisoli]GCF09493.1 hypothetical protein KDI_30570 [Dictyobacter arantiisoli]